jgi:hypothetical protein
VRPIAVLVSLASLLLGLGFGAVLTQNPEWAPVAIGSALAIYAAAGALSLPVTRRAISFLRTKEDKDDLLRVFLAACLSDVAGFRERLGGPAVSEKFTPMLRSLESWISETSLELDKLRPGWGALFLSNPITVQYSSGSDWSNLSNHLDQREAALRDLMKLLP